MICKYKVSALPAIFDLRSLSVGDSFSVGWVFGLGKSFLLKAKG